MKLERDKRYVVETEDTTKYIKFSDFQGAEQSCRISNYSRTGLAFIMEDGSLVLRIGDIISDLCFYSVDTQVYRGSVTIIHIQDEEEEGKVFSNIGCSFSDGLLDISSMLKGDKVTKLHNDFMDFIRSMALEDNLDPEFVNLTSHMHYLFTGFHERLMVEEETIMDEEPEIRSLLVETLKELAFNSMYEELTRYYDRFTRIIGRFNHSKQHFIHREFYQKRLMHFYHKSKLFNRAFKKPRGYAGDYEMMNIIYRNDFEGETVFEQVMNKIDCEGPAAKAVRNRRSYLHDKLISFTQNLPKASEVKILSVACGPALEFYDFVMGLQGKKLSFKINYLAMDQDTLALDDARARIEPAIKGHKNISAQFIEDNIKRMIVGQDTDTETYENTDLIYTAGLFDYLSERAAIRLIQKLYTFLNPGGTLVIGNFGLYNPQRFVMEYGAEWFLIHRSEEELKELTKELPEDTIISIEKEPEGVNLFINISKPQ